eukprot:gnl/MRDRNA2_/MRDRNA2_91080_c0_seq1.p1 gnl/MRDRNA2_/MRDRNA2_91080_c0~~gnl/MRDRNA2_/MRDRNA2_91080_c0_seq1.p1  ORF type:complete len:1351 (-),score=292.33 gnl/MRDRNA2_/MRDRNA2_91080_c0_seq1:286-4338(-)
MAYVHKFPETASLATVHPECKLSLWHDTNYENGEVVRCGVQAEIPTGSVRRRKILAVVLDRSGSMAGAMWRRVVNGVVSVVNDKMLEDPLVTILMIVYSDNAQEVALPRSADGLERLLLSREFAPQGGTCFRAAFQTTQVAIQRELAKCVSHDAVTPSDIDVATLIFTDGEDTSVKGRAGRYGVRLVDKQASTRAARAAGDAFREALKSTGCSTYTCVAAFGADHDPQQCQYLSDRYYYINRGEVLSEVLSGGLGALLNSAGQCKIEVALPPCFTLVEPLPDSVSLDGNGRLSHHIWLRTSSACTDGIVNVTIRGAAVGSSSLHGSMTVDSLHYVRDGSFEEHLFLIDYTALQLRQVAQELCGQRPSNEELASLRARLVNAKDQLNHTAEVSAAVTGHLRGRAALRERLAEVTGLRERLSYALGHFDEHDQDERKIGLVAIDAILRDAGQHVPPGPAAAELARRADALAALSAPEALSEFGRNYTTDAYSCCDAHELAAQGDALFFQLSDVRLGPDGDLLAAEDHCGFIAHEAFQVLSRGGRQPVRFTGGQDEAFTHLGVPLYVTPGHFMRAQLFLPGALQPLCKDGTFVKGHSERILLGLLGRSLVAPAETEAHIVALVHKARSVHAVLSATPSPSGFGTLLDDVTSEAKLFLENCPGARASVSDSDLYAIAAAGMLSKEWKSAELAGLANALVAECLRRRVTRALRGADAAQRHCLAWGLLGSATEDDKWLDQGVAIQAAKELEFQFEGFNPFTASDELEALEKQSPGKSAPKEAGARALLRIVSLGGQGDGLPKVRDWGMLRRQLPAWAGLVAANGSLEALFENLDNMMITENGDQNQVLESARSLLRTSERNWGLRDAFDDASSIAAVATAACLSDVNHDEPIRLTVAKALRDLVERRRRLCCAFPIAGADFPKLDAHTRETVRDIWGAPANPVDQQLHHKAKLRVSRRYMKVQMSMSMKEALTDKEYRKRGGKFAFPTPLDTFIRGLHRRIADLHQDWKVRLARDTSGDEARAEAVEEMLLRLRWDDSNDGARAKLSSIVGRIWDGLEGVDLTGKEPLSSALWLNDEGLMPTHAPCVKAAVAKDETCDGDHDNMADRSPECDESTVAPSRDSNASETPGTTAVEPASVAEAVKAVDPAASVAEEESLEVAAEELDPAAEEEHLEIASEEVRIARDGTAYSLSDFRAHYGDERGQWCWEEAGQTQPAEPEESLPAPPVSPSITVDPVPVAMDDDLVATFNGISEEWRRSMERFTETWEPGSRLKLPSYFKAKQRKALHLWAEQRGLEHRSFGWAARRRLHLTVPGVRAEEVAPQAEDAREQEEFDWDAWASNDEAEDSQGESDDEN